MAYTVLSHVAFGDTWSATSHNLLIDNAAAPFANATQYSLMYWDTNTTINKLALAAGQTVVGTATAPVAAYFSYDFAVADGRLTLTSGVPVTTADVTGATNIYYTPYKGNNIGLFDGASTWSIIGFTEKTLALGTLTAGLPYDVFAYNNSGTVVLELLAWTSATARATALVYQNGILVKSGTTTRRYLGTFYTTGTTTTEDSAAKRYVWNYYNRVGRTLYFADATSHSYTTAAWRAWNNSTANKAQFIVGVLEDPISCLFNCNMSGAVSQTNGLDINSFTTATPLCYSNSTSTNNNPYTSTAIINPTSLSLGYNYLGATEYGIASGTSVSFAIWGSILG